MDPQHVLVWVKAMLDAGLAGLLSVFVVNNVTDPGTNAPAVGRMLSMRELRADPVAGRGVRWRAIDSAWVHRVAYLLVVLAQAGSAVVLWWATALFVTAGAEGYHTGAVSDALAVADLGLGLFIAMWLAIVVIGTWFTYWVKMGRVMQGHMTMLIVGLASAAFLNATP